MKHTRQALTRTAACLAFAGLLLTACGGAPPQRTESKRTESGAHTTIRRSKPGARQTAQREEKLRPPEVQGGWTTHKSEMLAVRGHDYKVPAATAYRNAVKTLGRLGLSVLHGQKDHGTVSKTTTTKHPRSITSALLKKHNTKLRHFPATDLRYSMTVAVSEKFGGQVSTVIARVFVEIYSREFRSWQQLTMDDGSILINFYGLLDRTMPRTKAR